MDEEERWARIKELQGVISKAEKELKKLEPHKPYLLQLQEELDVIDAERNAGEDYDSKGVRLCELATSALNMLNERLQGHVSTRMESLSIATDVGVIWYDIDSGEWLFRETP